MSADGDALDLDELERIAREVGGPPENASPEFLSGYNWARIAAFDPPTVLELIARVRAAVDKAEWLAGCLDRSEDQIHESGGFIDQVVNGDEERSSLRVERDEAVARADRMQRANREHIDRIDELEARVERAETDAANSGRDLNTVTARMSDAEATVAQVWAWLADITPCIELIDEGTNRCNEPAAAVAWGKIYASDGKNGPLCAKHFAQRHGPGLVEPNAAIVNLDPLRAVLDGGRA